MSWQFDIKAASDLFYVAVIEAEPNSEHTFHDDGRHEPVEGSPGIVRVDHVCALVEGSSITSNQYGSYESVDFAHDSPQWEGKQTGPYCYKTDAVAGPQGCTYVCFTAKEWVKLDYEVFQGPHKFTTPDKPSYAVAARGNPCLSGVGSLERWQPVALSPKFSARTECLGGNSIVFYIWER